MKVIQVKIKFGRRRKMHRTPDENVRTLHENQDGLLNGLTEKVLKGLGGKRIKYIYILVLYLCITRS